MRDRYTLTTLSILGAGTRHVCIECSRPPPRPSFGGSLRNTPRYPTHLGLRTSVNVDATYCLGTNWA